MTTTVRFHCEACEVWWNPTDWKESTRHPNGLGGHVVTAWGRIASVETHVEVEPSNLRRRMSNGLHFHGAVAHYANPPVYRHCHPLRPSPEYHEWSIGPNVESETENANG